MSVTKTKPQLVTHPAFPGGPLDFVSSPEVADFSEDRRPAYRVECHCRNCSWKGQTRLPVGERIPQLLPCPKCEVRELSAHGAFVARDEQTREERLADVKAAYAKRDEMWRKDAEIREKSLRGEKL